MYFFHNVLVSLCLFLSMISDISGVILAGGTNSRFGGRIKAKIEIMGKSIISRIIDTISVIFDELIIVTNTPTEFIEYQNLKLTSDEFLKIGPLGGIHAAIKASSKKAVFVFAGDMPLLDNNLIIQQIAAYEDHRCDILIPRLDEYLEPMHAIYNCSLRMAIENFISEDKSKAAREFIKRADVRYFDVEDSEMTKAAFMNVNFPADILIAEKILQSRNL